MRNLKITPHPSPNFEPRIGASEVRFLILHYTDCNFKTALKYLTDPTSGNRVSAHYLIDEDGTILQLVADDQCAWHAGSSAWGSYQGLNTWSIGIELVNPGHLGGYRPFPDQQMQNLIALCQGILNRHPIPPQFVLGHSDIAPLRKRDPGELFNWQRLAAEGIGFYPNFVSCVELPQPQLDIGNVQQRLAGIGYTIEQTSVYDAQTQLVIQAFQRHYSQNQVDGVLDSTTCIRLEHLYQSLKTIELI